jgi:hypothetical protein
MNALPNPFLNSGDFPFLASDEAVTLGVPPRALQGVTADFSSADAVMPPAGTAVALTAPTPALPGATANLFIATEAPQEPPAAVQRKSTPRESFIDQRSRAKQRGIAWEFSYEQWLSVWEASGHWNDRGRGVDRYCMSRKGDVGPYSIDNVVIAPFCQNSSDHPNKKKNLPMGVFQRVDRPSFQAQRRINGKNTWLGSYPSADAAEAAYLAAGESL